MLWCVAVSCCVLQFLAVCCNFLLCVEMRPGPLNGAFRQAHGIHSAVIRVKGGVRTLGVGVCVAECCSAMQVRRVRAVSRERVRKQTECKRNYTKQRASSFSGKKAIQTFVLFRRLNAKIFHETTQNNAHRPDFSGASLKGHPLSHFGIFLRSTPTFLALLPLIFAFDHATVQLSLRKKESERERERAREKERDHVCTYLYV